MTGISWTDRTWNPVRGCSRVSEGCRNCYAETTAGRSCGPGQPYEGLVRLAAVGKHGRMRWTGDVRFVAEHLADPLRWRKPRRIFVNSMSDLFHESLSNEQIAAVFGVMAAATQHTFQVLTKRAKRMREWFEWIDCGGGLRWSRMTEAIRAVVSPLSNTERKVTDAMDARRLAWPLPSVWLGVSVENQAAADERIPELLRTPAALRFLSCEPLLETLDVRRYMWPTHWSWDSRFATPEEALVAGARAERRRQSLVASGSVFIDWIIAGCESGPGARPCEVEWLRSLRDQCAAAEVPFFLKQARLGEGIEFCFDSRRKRGGIIELPYLDVVQHAAFPEVRR